MRLSSTRQPVYFVSNTYNTILLSLFISWPILYVLIFTTRPKFILGDTDSFVNNINNGSGTVITEPNGNLDNTLLSDKGRQRILWVSFLISFLISLIIYIFLQYVY